MAVRFLIPLLLLMTSLAWSSGFYRLEPNHTSAQSFLDEIEKKLPQKLIKAFPKGIKVVFDDINGHGKTRKNGPLTLNQKLLPVIHAGATNANAIPGRSHKTDFQEVQATVIHETAHLYDLLNKPDDNIQTWVSWCQSIHQNSSPNETFFA